MSFLQNSVMAVVTVGALALASPALAIAPVNYNEAVSGDIDTFTAAVDPLGQPTRTFIPLGAGANIFNGTINSPTDPVDVIPFSIDTGETLTGLSITLFDVLINSSTVLALDSLFTGQEPVNVKLQNYSVGLDFTGPDLFTLVIGGGVNVLSYQATLNLTGAPPPPPGVPEPAMWAMMLVGFGAIGVTLRSTRRRASAAA